MYCRRLFCYKKIPTDSREIMNKHEFINIKVLFFCPSSRSKVSFCPLWADSPVLFLKKEPNRPKGAHEYKKKQTRIHKTRRWEPLQDKSVRRQNSTYCKGFKATLIVKDSLCNYSSFTNSRLYAFTRNVTL